MDSKQKNWLGALWFLPLVLGQIRAVLGVIGDAQTALDLFQTQWIKINWDQVSQLSALVGIWYFTWVNRDFICERLHKKFGKKNFTFEGTRVVAYLAEDAVASTSFRGDKKYTAAYQALLSQVIAGSLQIGVLKNGRIQRIKPQLADGQKFVLFPKMGPYAKESGVTRLLISDGGKECVAEEIYFDMGDVLAIWPRKTQYN